jgi:hypothetical protein
MARNYFRIQQEHHTLKQMQKFNSADGGDGQEEVGGVCAVLSVNDLLSNTAFENFGSAEIVVLNGDKLADIYDGVRIYPTKVVATFSFSEFQTKVRDSSIYDYETL